MKDNYDFSKMEEITHPFKGESGKHTDWIKDISDDEFEKKLKDLDSSERALAQRQRRITRLQVGQ